MPWGASVFSEPMSRKSTLACLNWEAAAMGKNRHAALIALRRRALGEYLRQRREHLGLTQQQLAAQIGLSYYTHVSPVERGKARIPSSATHKWGKALQLDRHDWGKLLCATYCPELFEMVFGED